MRCKKIKILYYDGGVAGIERSYVGVMALVWVSSLFFALEAGGEPDETKWYSLERVQYNDGENNKMEAMKASQSDMTFVCCFVKLAFKSKTQDVCLSIVVLAQGTTR